ncbi:Uncharacterized protein dnl_15440 [Desulfonema limicola]|uniref:Lipoprotein n=1 Tax=Desulfonema limicola TaxID=45656 RepID=A0A975GFG8_9BACT|nr:hypothetical protein [Desulfonema limicola]QTA79286.1 Uncharacterized protein dnl_15440 [Desulfonema limicola]
MFKKLIRSILFFQICIIFVSCSNIPEIKHFDIWHKTDMQAECSSFFLENPRQFLHSIEVTMPGGKKGFVMGITRIFPEQKKIHCIMMTLEGLVLFDAVYDKTLEIRRGISPFDSVDFASGLMDDIGFIFFKPDTFLETGVMENSLKVCRFQTGLNRIIDIIIHSSTARSKNGVLFLTMCQYRNQKPARTVNAYHDSGSDLPGITGLASELELISHTFPGYTLNLKLVETERID